MIQDVLSELIAALIVTALLSASALGAPVLLRLWLLVLGLRYPLSRDALKEAYREEVSATPLLQARIRAILFFTQAASFAKNTDTAERSEETSTRGQAPVRVRRNRRRRWFIGSQLLLAGVYFAIQLSELIGLLPETYGSVMGRVVITAAYPILIVVAVPMVRDLRNRLGESGARLPRQVAGVALLSCYGLSTCCLPALMWASYAWEAPGYVGGALILASVGGLFSAWGLALGWREAVKMAFASPKSRSSQAK